MAAIAPGFAALNPGYEPGHEPRHESGHEPVQELGYAAGPRHHDPVTTDSRDSSRATSSSAPAVSSAGTA